MFNRNKDQSDSKAGTRRHFGKKAMAVFLATVMVAAASVPTLVLGNSTTGGGLKLQHLPA
jgi:hypothetical protein